MVAVRMNRTSYSGESRLAIGGMAEVMIAVERTAGGIPSLVVLKRLLPHLADDAHTVDDFLNEARMMAALHHPNIVQVRDLGRDNTGFFIVQEYLSGEDLRRVMGAVQDREMATPIPIACRIAADVAAALQFAHRAPDPHGRPMNLVHRDINPGNVIITFDGRVKLIDFGVAKSELRRRTTQPGAIKGQPAYVAPESLRGEPVDHRADIFSLGILLHEMLVGQPLFRRGNPAAVLDAILHDRIPPPHDMNPQVPKALDKVVLRTLDRDPGRRFASADQVREALEEVLRSVNLPVGPRQLANWMKMTMDEAHRARVELERTVRTKAGILEVRGSTPTAATVGNPPVAPAAPRANQWLLVGVASLFALLLLMLVVAAFLLGRSSAGGPGTAGI